MVKKVALMVATFLIVAVFAGTVSATTIEETSQPLEEALYEEESSEQTEAAVVPVVPIIEEEPARNRNTIPPVLILMAPILLGCVVGWFGRGFVDKKRGYGYLYDDEDEDDNDDVDDDPNEDIPEEEPELEPEPVKKHEAPITMSAEEILAEDREPDGYDEIKRPYWYDDLGQPFTIDEEGNPMYYYGQE